MQQRAVVGTSTVHEYDTVANAVRHLWAVDGLYGFYRGIAAHIVRSTPAASITLLAYEYVHGGLRFLRRGTGRDAPPDR